VRDAAEGYLALAEKTAEGVAAGKAYNWAPGPVSVLELVNEIVAVSGINLPPECRTPPPVRFTHQYLDPSLARAELGWEARTGLREGLAETPPLA